MDYSKFPRMPRQPLDEYVYSTKSGLESLVGSANPEEKGKDVFWTTDYTKELPIIMKKEGLGSLPPSTICETFRNMKDTYPEFKALSVQNSKNEWETINYAKYYELCQEFGKGLISLGVTPQKAVNIIGFNHPRWSIAFFGAIFGQYMPVGVYTTNGPDACQYVAEHSDAEVIVVENREHLKKYLKVWDQLPLLKYVILYKDNIPDDIPQEKRGQILEWDDLLNRGRNFKSTGKDTCIEHRMGLARPGTCCTLVYTSGTTGNPKGVMLSHDNYIWTARSFMEAQGVWPPDGTNSIVSFLPLSHVAAQMLDIVGSMVAGNHVYFAKPSALQGSLVETLCDVRPTIFFSVPRVWEKIYEKMMTIAASNGWLKTKISTWAKSIGVAGSESEHIPGKKAPFGYGLAKTLIYNNVKKAIGLDKTKWVLVGAAPLAPNIRLYFASLNILIVNAYGMSESTGPQTASDMKYFDQFDEAAARSCGMTIKGTDLIIYNPDKFGEGEICYRGRNRFMGYYKNEKATRETIDEQGYLHSGDLGSLDKNGNLTITGRSKELLITAGGENVAPVLIEEEIKRELKYVSNVMVVGDNKKFLSCLVTLKHATNPEGQLVPNQILPEAIVQLQQIGSKAKTIEEARNDPVILKDIQKGIDAANTRAISRAQNIQKWLLIDGDFTVEGGHLTPTLKLKRKVVTNMYQPQIESMYTEAKL